MRFISKHLWVVITLLVGVNANLLAQDGSQSSPDLSLFDLKGPVKSVKLEQTGTAGTTIGLFMDNHSFNFSEWGEWRRRDVTVGGVNYKVIRNHEGYVIALVPKSMDDSDYTYVIKWDGDKVASIQGFIYGYAWDVTNFVSKDGQLIPSEFIEDCADEGGSDGTIRVSDIKFDRYGNWTSRVLIIKGVTHPEEDEFTKIITQRRIFTYF